ncbi:MAG: PAS domain S-box protein [Gammaproteobacteria bacterium]|nr:PAS domain S-box protein [Gammaproteobacteria bacterium]
MPLNVLKHSSFRFITAIVMTFIIMFILVVAFVVDQINLDRFQQQKRAEVTAELGTYRAQLEGRLTANIQLVRGLASALSVEPNLSQEKFEKLARPLINDSKEIINLGAAPDMVLSYIYPLTGNEKAVGLNYLNSSTKKEDAVLARDTGKIVLAGPIDLVQGGVGLIGRIPIYQFEDNDVKQFWGLLSVVIDMQAVYESSGLVELSKTYEIAIAKYSNERINQPRYINSQNFFYGDSSILESNPVSYHVRLPEVTWELYLVPKNKWALNEQDIWLFRGALIVIAITLIIVSFFLLQLYRKNRASEKRLTALFSLSPVGIALRDFETGKYISVNHALLKPTGFTEEEFLSLNHDKIIPKKYHETDYEIFDVLTREGQYGPYEKEIIRKDGSTYPVSSREVLFRSQDGKSYIWSIIEDLSSRKAYEYILKENARQLELVIENTAVGIWDWNIPTGEVVFNERWAEIIGYTLEELHPVSIETWMKFAHPDDLAESDRLLEQCWCKEIPQYVFEARMRHKSGSWVWVLDSGRVIEWNLDGSPKRMIGTHIDITQQKNNVALLEKQQKTLESMSDLARVGAWELDLESNELYWSKTTKQIHEVPLDYRPDLNTAIEFYKTGKSRDTITQVVERCMQTGQSYEVELQIITAKGNETWISAQGDAEFRDGKCVRLFGSFQDINERKEAEIQIQRISKHNRLLAEMTVNHDVITGNFASACKQISQSVSDALDAQYVIIWKLDEHDSCLEDVCIFDGDRHRFLPSKNLLIEDYQYFFDSINQTSYIAAHDVNEQSETQLFLSANLDDFESGAMLCAAILSGKKVIGAIAAIHLSRHEWSQNEISFLLSVKALLNNVHSNQQRHIIELNLRKAKEEAENATKIKSDFLASMSHEIRTPINGVLGMLSLLKQQELEHTAKHQVELAYSAGESLLSVINDILDFSKIEAGKLDIEYIEFDLLAFVQSVVENFEIKAEEKNIELLVDISEIGFQQVSCDPGRLRQILNNLLSNALKFTEKGVVKLTCNIMQNDQGFYLECRVKDTGIGISQEQQQRLFLDFTQADSSTTRKFGGTGLGLAIVKRLCELMGGEISVYSNLEEGSEFSIRVKLNNVSQPMNELVKNTVKKDLLSTYVMVKDDLNGEQVIQQLNQFNVSFNRIKKLDECESIVVPSRLIISEDCYHNDSDLEKALSNTHIAQIILIKSVSSHKSLKSLTQSFPNVHDLTLFKPVTLMGLLSCFEPIVCSISPKTHTDAENLKSLNLSVLLVEDNRVNQTVAKAMLTKLNLSCEIANNGLEALSILQNKSNTIDLVLMDCQMPQMDGYQATAEIRNGTCGDSNKEIPIIALTANALKGDKERCLAAGMNDYLSKPLSIDRLNEMLVKWNKKL